MARILVIDDDASLLQMMSLMLKRAGHEPILASAGQEGIEIARAQQPDMAIIDVMMPNLSGYEVSRILRQDPSTRNIPLLVLTALSQPEQRELAAEAGADDFVTKPVTRDDLTKHVNELLATGPRNMPANLGYKDDTQPVSYSEPAAPAPSRPVPMEAAQPASLKPITAVMGLRSGVGATTVAVNLGVTLNQTGRSCIVDFNNQIGQVAVHLRMVPPKSTWQDLLTLPPGGDKRAIGSALMLGQAAGIAVLAAPLHPVADMLGEGTLQYVLTVLVEGFAHIVVDLPSTLNAMSAVTLREAQNVILVAGGDPADLILVPEALANIERLGLPGNVHVVLNHTRPHGVSTDDLMQALNRPIMTNVPYEPEQVTAITQGVPLVMSQPDSLFSRTILTLAKQL